MYLLKSLLSLLVPGILFCAAVYLQRAVTVDADWQPLLALYPYLAIIAGVFFAWRFNRTRVLWTIVMLVVVERALTMAPPSGREYLLQIVPLLVPLNLVLYSWWTERGLFTRHGLLRLVFLLLQSGALFWLYSTRTGGGLIYLDHPLFANAFLQKFPFTQITLLIMLFCLLALLGRFFRKPAALEGGFCWVLMAVAAGFWWPDSFAFWVGTAVFILTIAIVESTFMMAFSDELTGLPARRAMNEFLLKVGRCFTIAMVDVDHFKKVNDIHGHDVGDQVLRLVATCLRRVNGGGRAYRYGGEEFVVIFPNKDLQRSMPYLEELRATIASAEFVVRSRKRPNKKPQEPLRKKAGKTRLKVTVSIGVASRDDRNTTPEQLIKASDQALYKAKKGGRNRVCS